MPGRMRDTARRVGDRYPHWGDPRTGDWTTTADGDCTGGFWIGLHWLAHRATGDDTYRAWAERMVDRLRGRVAGETVFKGFPFDYGAALGAILAGSASAREVALLCAADLMRLYDPVQRLVPLGRQAEEGSHVGGTETSIDSLQAAPFLFWAARETGDTAMRRAATDHAERVITLHLRDDDSFIQSTSLDPATGASSATIPRRDTARRAPGVGRRRGECSSRP